MKHTISHNLPDDLVKLATRKAFAAYGDRFADYNPTAMWTSDTHADVSFEVKSFKLTGALDLKPKAIELELDVPFAFRPFKGKALSIIEGEIQKWLDRARAGDLTEEDADEEGGQDA